MATIDTSNILAQIASGQGLRMAPDPYAENALRSYVQQREDEDAYRTKIDNALAALRRPSMFGPAVPIYKQPGAEPVSGRDGDAIDYLRSLVHKIPSIDTSRPSEGWQHALTDAAMVPQTLFKAAGEAGVNWLDAIAQASGYKSPTEFSPIGPGEILTPPGTGAIAALLSGVPRGALGSGGGKLTSSFPMDEASRLARAKKMGFDTDQVSYHGTIGGFDAFDPALVGTSGTDYGRRKAYWFSDDPKVASDYATVAPRIVRDAAYEAKMVQHELDKYKDELRGIHGPFGDRLSKSEVRKLEELEENAMFFRDLADDHWSEWVNSAEHALGVPAGANVIPAYLRMRRPLEIDAKGGRFDSVMPNALRTAEWDNHSGLIVRNVIDPASSKTDFPTTVRAVFDPADIRSIYAAFNPRKSKSSNLLSANPREASLPGAVANAMERAALPMDEASRLARAREMGFDTDTTWYHGANTPFAAFDKNRIGSKHGDYSFGFHLTNDPAEAAGYGMNVKPLFSRARNPYVVDAPRFNASQTVDMDRTYLFNRALTGGHDAVLVRGADGNENLVVFDPTLLRRVDAAFDPMQSQSANLLAANPAQAAIPGLLLQEPYQE